MGKNERDLYAEAGHVSVEEARDLVLGGRMLLYFAGEIEGLLKREDT